MGLWSVKQQGTFKACNPAMAGSTVSCGLTLSGKWVNEAIWKARVNWDYLDIHSGRYNRSTLPTAITWLATNWVGRCLHLSKLPSDTPILLLSAVTLPPPASTLILLLVLTLPSILRTEHSRDLDKCSECYLCTYHLEFLSKSLAQSIWGWGQEPRLLPGSWRLEVEHYWQCSVTECLLTRLPGGARWSEGHPLVARLTVTDSASGTD